MNSQARKQRIDCPKCQKQYGVPEKNLRPWAVCKKCGTKFALPIVSAQKSASDANGEKQVFISYSSIDEETASQVLEALEQREISCWMAPRDIQPGADWGASIIRGIECTETMLLLFSKHSNLSKQVLREVERAVSKSNPIIPFRIDNCEMSQSFEYFLSSTHWFDASEPPLQTRIDELLPLLHQNLKSQSKSPKEPIAKQASITPPVNSAQPKSAFWQRLVFRLKMCACLCVLLAVAYLYLYFKHPVLAKQVQVIFGAASTIEEIKEGGSEGEPIESWSVLRTLSGHSNAVNTVQFDFMNRQLLSGSTDDTMKLWDLTTGECLRTFRHSEDAAVSYTDFLAVVVSPTKDLVVTAHDDKVILFWDWNSGKFVKQIRLERYARAIDISPNESLLAIGDYSHVMLWDFEKEKLRTLPEIHNQIRQVEFLPDGTHLVSVDRTGTLRVIENSTGEVRRTINASDSYEELHFGISHDGLQLAVGGTKSLAIWNLKDGTKIHQLTNPQMAQVESVRFSPDGRFLVSGHRYSIIFIWDPETGKLLHDFGKSDSTLGVLDLSFSSDSNIIAIARRNGDIEIRATQID